MILPDNTLHAYPWKRTPEGYLFTDQRMVSMATIPDKYVFLRDTSTGDKVFTVPGNRIWMVQWAHVRVQSTETPGSRCINMLLRLPGEPDKPLARFLSPVYQGEGRVVRYQFLPCTLETPNIAHNVNVVYVPTPEKLVLDKGWEILFEDMNKVDPADHIEVRSLVMLQARNF